jgi:acetyl esterase/lipase
MTKLFALLLVLPLSTFSFSQTKLIPLYEGAPKGSETWTQQEREMLIPGTNILLVQNVVKPSLHVFYPPKEIANGAAIIVAPGGGFETIVEGVEGTPVADSLTARGFTVFLLRYRLLKTNDNFLYTADKKSGLSKENRLQLVKETLRPFIIEDAKAAVRYVRSHATEFGIRKDRIGFMGFSAGGMVASLIATEYDSSSRPDFVAPIYGAFEDEIIVPKDAPPIFLAQASDDKVVGTEGTFRFYNAWLNANKNVELHVFEKGGHGFGALKKNLPVDHWISIFYYWLQGEGFVR